MMEDAKTSVDEQLSQIDAKLALEPVSTSEDVQPAQVLSSDGIQDADLDPAHDPIASEPLEPTLGDEMQSEAPHAAGVPELELASPMPVAEQGWGEQPLQGTGLEGLEVPGADQVPDALTQVLSSFSDSWVTEMSQRVDVLKEQITVVHHKLDQFSPR